MNKNIYAIISSIMVIFILTGCTNDNAETSYDQYVEMTESIQKKFNETFEISQNSFNHTKVEPYRGNVDGKWADTIGDNFEEIIDNNLVIGASKKREIYIIFEEAMLIGKVGLHYSPNMTERTYLAINTINQVSEMVMLDEVFDIPRIMQQTFTNPGLVIQITIFSTDDNMMDNESIEIEQGQAMLEVTTLIQEILLDLE